MLIFVMANKMSIQNDKIKMAYPYWIDQTIKRMRQHSEQQFRQKGFDITIDQWMVLKCINEQDRTSSSEIVEIVFKDAPTVTRIIDKLCKKGWVVRELNPIDRRKFDVSLTKEGKKLVKKMFPIVEELRGQGIKGITKKDMETLRTVLEKIQHNIS
jgi:DNA-binding MarR family transcriptional regulator